jgi:D-alanyl-D-alanine carboxypeptidase
MGKKPFFATHCLSIRLIVEVSLACSTIFCSLFISGLAPTFVARAAGNEVFPRNAFLQRLYPQLYAQMEEMRVPGAIVFVHSVFTGSWTAALGTSNLVTQAPMQPNMHFRIGSITKTFIGTVILQLIDEGKLHLNDPVSAFEPEVPNGKNITIRELLNMTSGLYNYSEDFTLERVLDTELKGIDPGRIWEPYELLATAFKHPPYFAPGQGFHYSDTNYILLGQIIERITNHSIPYEIQHRIFTPLGMRHSSIPEQVSSALPAPRVQGYTFDTLIQPEQAGPVLANPLNVTFVNPSWGGSANDAISTLNDLKIWVKALVDGTLISPALQRQQLSFVPLGAGISTDIKYGLAIADFGGYLGQNGALPGFQSFAAYNPANDATVIVLTNVDPSANGSGPADELAKVIISNLNGGSPSAIVAFP